MMRFTCQTWDHPSVGNPYANMYPSLQYGREELDRNQFWYGLTALALVAGFSVYVSLFFHFTQATVDPISRTGCGYPFLSSPPLPPPPKGNLAQGTKVDLYRFKVPVPAPDHQVIEFGIAQDQKVRDSDSKEESRFNLYSIPEKSTHPDALDLPTLFEFEFENREGEEFGFCGCQAESMCDCYDRLPAGISYYRNKIQTDIDMEPIPLNLPEMLRKLSFPDWSQEVAIGGRMKVKLWIDKKGRYARHEMIQEIHPNLTREVDKHISKLLFTPAIRNGIPVPRVIHLPIYIKFLD